MINDKNILELENPLMNKEYIKDKYIQSKTVRKVLIFANFAGKTFSRIQESREYYYYSK